MSNIPPLLQSELNRQNLRHCKRIVIKIGTSSLTDEKGHLEPERLSQLTQVISKLVLREKKEVLLVTSGAIGAGVGALGFLKRPKELPMLQMAAAIGQSRLMSVYADLFAKEKLLCAQILLTHDDLKNRSRHVNAVNTFDALLSHKVIPVINENDVVAVDEIKVGDNDTLAAMVAIMSKADLLVLLTTSNGLRTSNSPEAERIPFIPQISPRILSMAHGKTNQFSTGGMQTKLLACRMASNAGISSLILNSKDATAIHRALLAEDVGTLVCAKLGNQKILGKKRYMGFFRDVKGSIIIDEGATKSLLKGTSSLLAVGLAKVQGAFDAGSVIEIRSPDGQELGRGVSGYSSKELQRIKGKRSTEIYNINTSWAKKPVIHKDEMYLL